MPVFTAEDVARVDRLMAGGLSYDEATSRVAQIHLQQTRHAAEMAAFEKRALPKLGSLNLGSYKRRRK